MSTTMDAKTLSRRVLMGTALASAAVASVPVVVQAAEPDPIFAAIEAHKAVHAVVCAACDDITAAELEIGLGEVSQARKSGNATRLERCEDALSAAHDAEDDAASVLVTVAPTTLPGVLALLEYANAADTDGEGWPRDLCEDDEDGTRTRSWHYFLIERLADALPGIVGVA
jgi:hypothetical protein